MASELRSAGVDFSFAPVLDLQTDVSRVIGDRAFSPDPLAVGRLAYAWSRGAREAGMASVGKHFPGHGKVAEDSHHELPRDDRPFEEIWDHDLLPFRHMVDNNLEGIMPAHVIYACCDRLPAGYSPFWIRRLLRERMGFQGVVFSDDLSMAAAAEVAGEPAQRARLALEAGCDMVLVCNDPAAAGAVLEELESDTDPVRQVRMARMHGTGGVDRGALHEDPRWPRAMEFLAMLEDESPGDLELELT
jgi:beta-N-acetylhexosaminidase